MHTIACFSLLAPLLAFSAAANTSRAGAVQSHSERQGRDDSDSERVELRKALARAAKENRRVLVQWISGGGGRAESRYLEAAMKAQGVRRKLMYEYDVVTVDLAMSGRGNQLAMELGVVTMQKDGPPHLTALDASSKVLAHTSVEPWLAKDDQQREKLDDAALLAWLTEHQAPYLEASKVRDAAFARAMAENKRVFLHFGAPWCGWCHKLEGWMERPEVAPVLAKQFVDLKIDTDRMTGGGDMLKAARTAAGLKPDGGIPWFVFYDADGKPLANSEGPKGNVGYPYQDDEIAFFVTMLEAARTNLTEADLATLRDSMLAVRREDDEKKAAAKAKDSK